MTECLFWFSVLFVLYTYVGYPVVLLFMGLLFPKKATDSGTQQPIVSVVIAARNEASRIAKRLRNLVEQDYPQDRMEIIVVSDGSTDGTADGVREFALSIPSRGVRLIELAENRGKPTALNAGVSDAKGDIVVFADSRQEFERSAVSALVCNFSDPQVGCVSGELFLADLGGGGSRVEMGVYWAYEKWIRKSESWTGSVVGATGAIYAIRRNLYKELPEETLLDDVLTPLNIIMQGYRVVYEVRAKAYDQVSGNVQEEWRRKVRTLAGNWQLLSLKPGLLLLNNPIWWRFISHKINRLLVPGFLITALLSSAYQGALFYKLCAYLQLCFYGISIIAAMAPSIRRFRLVNLTYFFMAMNLAAAVAFWKWAMGDCKSVWRANTMTKENQIF